MVTPLTAVANVATMLAVVPDGFVAYQTSELLFWASIVADAARDIEMPPTDIAVSWAVPALVESSQLMLTTVIRFGLAPPTPWAVKVIEVPEEVEQALLTGVVEGSVKGSQPAAAGVIARARQISK